MCRSIQPLHNYEPPPGDDEVRAAALQYVRKISGMTRSAQVNQAAFDRAVATTPPHNRAIERQRARARWERRQAPAQAGGPD